MRAKEYLRQYAVVKAQVLRDKNDYEELMSVLDIGSLDYTKDKVQAPYHDAMAEAVANAEAYAEALREDLSRLLSMRGDIIELINIVPDSRLRLVLTARYINEMTFDEIADCIGKTRRTAERLHGQALQRIDSDIIFEATSQKLTWRKKV